MSFVRPIGAAVVGPIAVFAAMMAGASAVHAAPYTDDATISLGGSDLCVDESVVIDGSGFAPGEQVVIDLLSDPIRLGTVTADGNGDFSLRVRVPDDSEGDHVVTARGLTSGRTASTEVDIHECDDDDDHDHDGHHDHDDDGGFAGLPRTGAAVGGLGVAGLALIGGGIAVRRYRRRSSES